MRCPSLADLPPPHPDKTGWPWTEECRQLPSTTPNGSTWPRISIVTPNFNNASYLEETIRSILLQGYPDLEYIVIDGGSTDGSTEIIKKYEPWMTFWLSEKDSGQADAINKGLARSTGMVFQFINSDDLLEKNALHLVGSAFGQSSAFIGAVMNFTEDAERLIKNKKIRFDRIFDSPARPHQPGVFLNCEHVKALGGYDSSYWYFFDIKLFILYFARFPKPQIVTNECLVRFRKHADAKTSLAFASGRTDMRSRVEEEENRLFEELASELPHHAGQQSILRHQMLRAWRQRITALESSDLPSASIFLIAAREMVSDPRLRLRGFCGLSFRLFSNRRQRSVALMTKEKASSDLHVTLR